MILSPTSELNHPRRWLPTFKQAVLASVVLLFAVGAQAQTLTIINSNAKTNEVGHVVVLSFEAAADSGSFDFEFQYANALLASVSSLTSSIPGATPRCRQVATRRVRCLVVAPSQGAPLASGFLTFAFNTGPDPGTFPIGFNAVHFYNQQGAVQLGAVNSGNIQVVVEPQLSIQDVSIVEGNAGSKQAVFTVNLSPTSAQAVSFDIGTTGGTAQSNVDFAETSVAGLVIPAGQSSVNFSVAVNGDSAIEANETFAVSIGNASGAGLADGQALGTIVNDDNATLSISDSSAIEGNQGASTATFVVTLSHPMAAPVRFDLATSAGTAASGVDFAQTSQIARTIDPGRTRVVFEVPILVDVADENDETFSVSLTNAVGASVLDGGATGTIVDDDAPSASPTTTISQIQGTGSVSPWVGKKVTTEGVVTALVADGFYLQEDGPVGAATGRASRGLFVAGRGTEVTRGDRLRVAGMVSEATRGAGVRQLTLTQLVAGDVETLARGQRIPDAVTLGAPDAGPDQDSNGLERFESMRVSIKSLGVVAASGGLRNARTGQVVGDGRFYGVVAGVARPFVEPGMDRFERVQMAAGTRPATFDGNPERLLVDTLAQRDSRGASADVGDVVSNVVGVLSYGSGAYQVLPDAEAPLSLRSASTPSPAPPRAASQAIIGSVSLGNLVESREPAGAVAAANAYALQLAKTANVICAFARSPDILAVTDVASREQAVELAGAVNAGDGNALFSDSCGKPPRYRAQVLEKLASEESGIGFLVDSAEVRPGVSRVEVVSTEQVGSLSRFKHRDGSQQALFESTPRLIRARLNSESGSRLELTVLVGRLSKAAENPDAPGAHGWSSEGRYWRARRSAQAAYLASYIQRWQLTHRGEKLVVLGNFEASEFDDGHADLLGLISGRPVPRNRVISYLGSPVAQALTNLTARMPANDRYSVVRNGNAQAVDHILVNDELLRYSEKALVKAARVNADFSEDNSSDAAVPMRVSDHDPMLLYFELK